MTMKIHKWVDLARAGGLNPLLCDCGHCGEWAQLLDAFQDGGRDTEIEIEGKRILAASKHGSTCKNATWFVQHFLLTTGEPNA